MGVLVVVGVATGVLGDLAPVVSPPVTGVVSPTTLAPVVPSVAGVVLSLPQAVATRPRTVVIVSALSNLVLFRISPLFGMSFDIGDIRVATIIAAWLTFAETPSLSVEALPPMSRNSASVIAAVGSPLALRCRHGVAA